MSDTLAKLRPLGASWKSILGALGVIAVGLFNWLKKFLEIVDTVSNFDFLASITENKNMRAVWEFLISDTGRTVFVVVGFALLAVIVLRKLREEVPASDAEVGADEEKQWYDTVQNDLLPDRVDAAPVPQKPVEAKSLPEAAKSPVEFTHIGLSGTGVTAKVIFTMVHSFGGHPNMLTIENTSVTGTITNIGFILDPRVEPKNIEVVKGEGRYAFVNEPWEIILPDFKLHCSFGLWTKQYFNDVSASFQKGYIGSGVKPGSTTQWFFGVSFQAGLKPDQIIRGVVLRFEGIGDDSRADIAVYKNVESLLPTYTEPSPYHIERVNK